MVIVPNEHRLDRLACLVLRHLLIVDVELLKKQHYYSLDDELVNPVHLLLKLSKEEEEEEEENNQFLFIHFKNIHLTTRRAVVRHVPRIFLAVHV